MLCYKVRTQTFAMRGRISVSILIACASGFVCWSLLHRFNQGAADFQWALRAAQRTFAGQNPYDTPFEQYPLTAAIFAIPFIRLQADVAAAAFFGLSSGLLAFGLTRHSYTRLLIFLAYPYWTAILTAQWAPLIMASAFFPLLLPFTMAKPQVGLPIALTHLTRKGAISCAVLFLLSLALRPSWPIAWWGQRGYYQHFIPLLVWPGPLLVLALLRHRNPDAWLFSFMSLMPQRWFFDASNLLLIPKSRRDILFTVILSWGAGIWRWYNAPHSMAQVGKWAILFLYFPCLVILLKNDATNVASLDAKNLDP
jgi:hypothetical protein